MGWRTVWVGHLKPECAGLAGALKGLLLLSPSVVLQNRYAG